MCNKFFLLFFGVICILGIQRNVFSQENQLSSILLLNDWSVAILGVQTDNYNGFSNEQKSISVRLQPILAYIIKNVDVHFLTSEEKRNAQILQKEEGIKLLSKQIETAQYKIDNEILNTGDGTSWQKRNKSMKEIKKIQKQLARLQKLDPKNINVKETLNVKFVEETSQNQISNLINYRDMANNNKAHLLIYYKLYQLENYIIVDLFEYNLLLNRSRRILKTIVEPNNIEGITQSLSLNLTNTIKGVTTAKLNINVFTTSNEILYDAKILVDGVELGFGTAEMNNIVSGTHVIDVIYRNIQQQAIIVLNTGELLSKDFFVNTSSEDVILVRTNPSNAKLYVDAEWKGNTPVAVARPLLVANVELALAGYEKSRLSLSLESPKIIDIVLTPTQEIPLKERFDRDRRKFYNAFTFFAVSLVVPIVLNGFYINELNALNAGAQYLSADELSKSTIRRDALYYSYLGSVGISAGLSIFTMLRLRQYLKTASEYQER